jgi:hypothetical protein
VTAARIFDALLLAQTHCALVRRVGTKDKFVGLQSFEVYVVVPGEILTESSYIG